MVPPRATFRFMFFLFSLLCCIATAQNTPIKDGYVAFGDSYAAGIGAGNTDTGGCRQGQFSYPRQLASMVSQKIDFQNYPCSGAIVKNVLQGGPESQVDKWQTPGNADIATISIGGNDVGFFDVLTACVIHAAGSFTQGCDVAINIANQKRNDTLSSDIALALNQIIDKAGRNRAPFRIYHVGYPVFFNADTNSCNDTTFNIWRPEHDPSHRNGGPYLDKALRLKLNQLTVNLNQFLASIADTVNAQYQQKGYTYNPVTFVDPNPHFDNHRFCERDIGTTEVTEPDSNRLDTWLFFRDWPDNTLPVANISSRDLVNNAPGDDSLQASSLPPLPDPGSCKIALGDDSNWDDRILCDMAQAVSNTSDLPYQVYTSGQENAHNAGNFSVLAVAWWLPTRLAKTFHPRTLGQQALKQAVVDVW